METELPGLSVQGHMQDEQDYCAMVKLREKFLA